MENFKDNYNQDDQDPNIKNMILRCRKLTSILKKDVEETDEFSFTIDTGKGIIV